MSQPLPHPPNTTKVFYTHSTQMANPEQSPMMVTVINQQSQQRSQSPYSVAYQNQQRSAPSQSPQSHSVNSSCASSPQQPSLISNSQESHLLSQTDIAKNDERMVLKCAHFFKSLLKFKATASQEQQSVLQLLREGVMSEISAEEFSAKLRDVTGSQDKGTLLPFLKKALPLLRISIRNDEQPELFQVLRLDNRLPLSLPLHAQDSLNGSVTVQMLPNFPTPQSQHQNSHQIKTLSASSQSFIVHERDQKLPMTIKQEFQTQEPLSQQRTHPSQKIMDNQIQVTLPTVISTNSINPVPPELPATSANSQLDNLSQMLLNPQTLADRILAYMPDAQGVDAEVLTIISMAAEVRLRAMLAHLATLAEHRQEPLRMNPNYVLLDEPRKQMRFMEDIERRSHESRETAEKEALMRVGKSKGKDRDTLEKAKQLQKADREAMVNREANLAAFAALGNKIGLKHQFGANRNGGNEAWRNGMQGQGLGEGLTRTKRSSMTRMKRVTMRDLQYYLCNDSLTPSNSRLRHRIALSTLNFDENNQTAGGGKG